MFGHRTHERTAHRRVTVGGLLLMFAAAILVGPAHAAAPTEKPSQFQLANGLQVVVGPMADGIASDIRAHLASGGGGIDARVLLEALGGKANVAEARAAGGRVLVTLRDPGAIDRSRLESVSPRGVAYPARDRLHLLHAEPEALEAALAPLLR